MKGKKKPRTKIIRGRAALANKPTEEMNMEISDTGEVEQVAFWPAEEIELAFKRVNAATGTPEELEEMRLFVRIMNYFYEQASIAKGSLDNEEMAEVCRLAKSGLYAEFGIMPEPEVKA
jgi:hypothetical protein